MSYTLNTIKCLRNIANLHAYFNFLLKDLGR